MDAQADLSLCWAHSHFCLFCRAHLSISEKLVGGCLGQAMVLGSFQCRGVLLLWHMVGQGPAVLAAGAGRVGCFFFLIFLSCLSYLPFLMPHLWEMAGHAEILWSRPL